MTSIRGARNPPNSSSTGFSGLPSCALSTSMARSSTLVGLGRDPSYPSQQSCKRVPWVRNRNRPPPPSIAPDPQPSLGRWYRVGAVQPMERVQLPPPGAARRGRSTGKERHDCRGLSKKAPSCAQVLRNSVPNGLSSSMRQGYGHNLTWTRRIASATSSKLLRLVTERTS